MRSGQLISPLQYAEQASSLHKQSAQKYIDIGLGDSHQCKYHQRMAENHLIEAEDIRLGKSRKKMTVKEIEDGLQ